MKMTQITQNSYQLTQLRFVNCYLVRENDGFSLIDTGVLKSGAAEIVDAVRELGGTIRRILLTHAHADHVGAVDSLVTNLGADNVELISNARSLPLLKKPADSAPVPGEPADKIKGGLPGIAARPTRLLAEGDAVASLRCIDTPGHIPGHISFLDERDGTLFAGDALVAMGELNVSSFAPWFFPFPRWVTWNKEWTMTSAEKLLAYPIQRFACGHGPVREGGTPALRQAIEKVRG